jgi:hypothetical protein
MVVFVKSAPSNCKVVLATCRRSRLHQVKSHNPSTTSQLVFVCEDDVSFEQTHHTSSATVKKCARLGGIAIAAKCDVKEGSWFVSWCFLVKWCATLPSEGVEEDLLFGLWSINIEEVLMGFLPHEDFPG